MAKKALITGITGQDGAYLAEFLIKNGYKVYGSYRRISTPNFWRLEYLDILDKVDLVELDLLDAGNCVRVLQNIMPEEVYNLAAQSFVSTSFEQPIITGEITGLGVARLLEAIRIVNPDIKFYQASSSEMFGMVEEIPQSEKTFFHPRSPYAIAKLYAYWMTVNYREAYNIFTCSGILFNHESPLRGIEFVTKKITFNVARIKYGIQDKLRLGNLDARRDWGYAPEYVEAMWLMLHHSVPNNYVIATGKDHSVREFVELSFRNVDIEIEWQGKGVEEKGIDKKTGKVMVEVDPKFFRPADVNLLVGDASKAKKELGWKPKTKFEDLVKIMMKADLERVKEGMRF